MATELAMFDPGPGDGPAAMLTTPRGGLPLCTVSVRADITGVTADVEVVQVFENPYDESLEVSYVFPLPERAAVTRCELRIAERVIAAQLQERGAARRAYAEATERGQRAALAEQERPGVFTITLGNLPPRAPAIVRFAMAYPLPREHGRHVFRFPLVVAERYVPGAPLGDDPVGEGTAPDTTQTPDASRLSPPRLAAGAERPMLDIQVALIHGGLGVDELETSLHAVEDDREPNRRIVRLVPGQAMDRDFVLRFRIGGAAIRSQLAVQPDAAGDEGTFQLTIAPPAAPIRPRPRDVALVLDRSGSMDGWKIVAARRALARMIDALDDGDRFAAYAFGSETLASADLAFDRLHPATARHRARACEFLQGVSAWGGTEMAHPLGLAIGLLGAPDRPDRPDPARDRWLVLVTDGQVANEDALVALVAGVPGVKLLALGIDDAVNSSLLHRLASATGGRVEIVGHMAELEDALDRLHLLLAAPALERITVAGDGILDDTLVPAGPLHAFPGAPLVIRGRYRGSLPSLRVTAIAGREPFELAVAAEPAELPTAHALRACWAREHLLALEDRFAAHAEQRGALAARILDTSLRSGVLCRFTAFVAVDDRGPIGAVAGRHVAQPVEPAPARAPAIALHSTVPVTRWGGSHDTTRNRRTMTGTLRMSGKLRYGSPEQLRCASLEPPHEVYGLAHLLCELVTGAPLFHGANDFDLLNQIMHGMLPTPLVPRAASALEPVLRRALDRDGRRRHATPLAFAEAVEAVAPRATAAEVAAWLAELCRDELAHQAALHAGLTGLHPPPGGYAIVTELTVTEQATLYFAARPGPGGPEAVALRRLHPDLAADPAEIERFLSEVSLAIDGIACTDDAGTDSAGGVFLAQPFVCGVDLGHVLAELQRHRRGAPPAIAVAVICDAARALERALSLPTPAGAPVGMLAGELAPSALRIAIDGAPVWTSLGIAPSPHHTPRRRLYVPVTAPPTLALGGQPAPPLPPRVGRWVVVPASVGAAPPASSPRRRRWLRWWLE